MDEDQRSSGWRNVDHAGNPDAFANYLDMVGGLDGVQARKRQGYSLLQIKEGDQILDVGCGIGEDVRALAQLVGPTGRVIGIDTSATLVAEAQKRTEDPSLPVEFHVGDATHLDFPSDTFDGCRADRVFQHLADREQALAEMIRVVRPGAWVVVNDPDWETLVVDSSDTALTRKIVNHVCDHVRHGWSGRQSYRLMKVAGFQEIICLPGTVVLPGYAVTSQVCGLENAIAELQTKGAVSGSEVTAWVNHLEQATQAGTFFSAATSFMVAGRKP